MSFSISFLDNYQYQDKNKFYSLFDALSSPIRSYLGGRTVNIEKQTYDHPTSIQARIRNLFLTAIVAYFVPQIVLGIAVISLSALAIKVLVGGLTGYRKMIQAKFDAAWEPIRKFKAALQKQSLTECLSIIASNGLGIVNRDSSDQQSFTNLLNQTITNYDGLVRAGNAHLFVTDAKFVEIFNLTVQELNQGTITSDICLHRLSELLRLRSTIATTVNTALDGLIHQTLPNLAIPFEKIAPMIKVYGVESASNFIATRARNEMDQGPFSANRLVEYITLVVGQQDSSTLCTYAEKIGPKLLEGASNEIFKIALRTAFVDQFIRTVIGTPQGGLSPLRTYCALTEMQCFRKNVLRDGQKAQKFAEHVFRLQQLRENADRLFQNSTVNEVSLDHAISQLQQMGGENVRQAMGCLRVFLKEIANPANVSGDMVDRINAFYVEIKKLYPQQAEDRDGVRDLEIDSINYVMECLLRKVYVLTPYIWIKTIKDATGEILHH